MAGPGWFERWRRRRILARAGDGPPGWAQVAAGFGFVQVLDEDERERLRQAVVIFLHDKDFSGVAGAQPRPDTALGIATQACILVLNLDLAYFGAFREILLYPDAFLPRREVLDEHGVLHEVEEARIGEAWGRGPVLLSLADLEPGPASRHNLVIHEFAHQMDMLNGAANGFPPLHGGMRRDDWTAAFSAAYEDLCERVAADAWAALDDYASFSPAEFFAVASEVFFEDPPRLLTHYPAVYAQLRLFYRQDPAARLERALRPG